MAVLPGLVRRVVSEADRHLRGRLPATPGDLLRGLARELTRPVELERLVAAQGERIARLEERLREQDAGLRAVRAELDSLVGQLNDRLLPRLDERLDDLERDLIAVATGMIRAGKEDDAARVRLDILDRRIGDLRGRMAQTEQRAGLWRELQATLARLGDDVDALRERLGGRTVGPVPDPITDPITERLTDQSRHGAERLAEPLGRGEAHA
ncbi:hypothetical protein GCM10009678_38820 [Actinomadura kijaniata]|uniref:Putative coiled-coil protein SlyX n=1 Tax=Actinomadura namibiensis TaxID=182080 RepID=A0A7W3QPQ0_ACTNM|nr:hypothetical protein [Actinomadura namibiensis]MBA8954869.1 putative coiled-coil protein SlyX [Actinomadura namibiensis]